MVIEVVYENARVSVELPEGISLTDATLDPADLEDKTEIELLVTVPEHKELASLLINSKERLL